MQEDTKERKGERSGSSPVGSRLENLDATNRLEEFPAPIARSINFEDALSNNLLVPLLPLLPLLLPLPLPLPLPLLVWLYAHGPLEESRVSITGAEIRLSRLYLNSVPGPSPLKKRVLGEAAATPSDSIGTVGKVADGADLDRTSGTAGKCWVFDESSQDGELNFNAGTTVVEGVCTTWPECPLHLPCPSPYKIDFGITSSKTCVISVFTGLLGLDLATSSSRVASAKVLARIGDSSTFHIELTLRAQRKKKNIRILYSHFEAKDNNKNEPSQHGAITNQSTGLCRALRLQWVDSAVSSPLR